MKYIYAASFLHESNTFSKNRSDLSWFQKRCWKLGEDVVRRFQGVRTEFGGFLDVFSDTDDMELLPLLAAEATPSGPVGDDVVKAVYEIVKRKLREAKQVDAVLLSLHGAMVTETSEDGDGDFLEMIRGEVGRDVPIYATLDLHANITKKMTEYADVLIPYDCYPHVDKYERGVQAAGLLVKALRKEIMPQMAVVKLPLLMPLIGTQSPVMEPVTQKISELEERSGVLNASITHGFINADIEECGAAVQVVTDNDPVLAEWLAAELAEFVWEKRDLFAAQYDTVEEAVRKAMKAEKWPVVISDGPDNPGGGSYADGTYLLRELIEQKCESALIALLCDAEAVEACERAGTGAELTLSIGGKHEPGCLGEPVVCKVRVLKLTDGKYHNRGPMNRGIAMDLGGTALIDIQGIRVILTKNPTQPYDLELLALHGLQACEEKIIVVKSAVHYRGAYEPVAAEILSVSYPGICYLDPGDVPFVKCRTKKC